MATIHISTPTDLQNINNDLTADYILDNDLDMTGVVFTPIGISSPFIGNFNGQNHTISNLTIDDTAASFGYCALFATAGDDNGSISTARPLIQKLKMNNIILKGASNVGALLGNIDSANIQNITVTNVTITGTGSPGGDMGGLGGQIYGWSNLPTLVVNCSVSGLTFNTTNGINILGGLFGLAEAINVYTDMYITNCSATNISMTVNQGTVQYVGGLVGQFEGYLNSCHCQGTMTVNNSVLGGSTIFYIGGCLGSCDFSSIIYNCFSNVSINISISTSSSLQYVGGFCGLFSDSSIVNQSYSVGSINISGNSNLNGIGGFIGKLFNANTKAENCYSHTSITTTQGDNSSIGGFAGIFYDGTILNCYATGVISSTTGGKVGGLSICGGFIGKTGKSTVSGTGTAVLKNSFSTGKVTEHGTVDVQGDALVLYIGGFIGSMNRPITTFTGCSWLSTSASNAIGNYEIASLAWSNSTTYSLGDKAWLTDILYQSSISSNHNITPPAGPSPSTWDSVTTYVVSNVVEYNHIFYYCQKDSPTNLNKQPDLFPDYWVANAPWKVISEPTSLTLIGAGIDEATESFFFSSDSSIFSAWDFKNIWVDNVTDYPTFVSYSPIDGTGVCPYLTAGEARKMVYTLSGLGHLTGQYVKIVQDGVVSKDDLQVVSAGTVTLSEPGAVLHIGLPYIGKIKWLPLGGDGQNVNQTKKRKLYSVVFRLWQSLGGKFGKDEDSLYTLSYDDLNPEANPLFTGDFQDVPVESSVLDIWEPVFVQDEPLPFMLLAAVMTSEISEDK